MRLIQAKDGKFVAKVKSKSVSPAGSTAAEAAGRRARRSPGYQAARERLEPTSSWPGS